MAEKPDLGIALSDESKSCRSGFNERMTLQKPLTVQNCKFIFLADTPPSSPVTATLGDGHVPPASGKHPPLSKICE